eukprot:CAMPEP_0177637340 /NCGR_PEP_ID=MMETSP0447-20121125/4920_1 /TAXON_ID=0 /ORGANISM="Stygamoeba regulata, Strain BSH-02190019" /LENGTH=1028 /DNA_ID=CAMNT_0019139263 /DNA_START=105 /DNA_END=3188 /DNA_ORIENTATION=+
MAGNMYTFNMVGSVPTQQQMDATRERQGAPPPRPTTAAPKMQVPEVVIVKTSTSSAATSSGTTTTAKGQFNLDIDDDAFFNALRVTMPSQPLPVPAAAASSQSAAAAAQPSPASAVTQPIPVASMHTSGGGGAVAGGFSGASTASSPVLKPTQSPNKASIGTDLASVPFDHARRTAALFDSGAIATRSPPDEDPFAAFASSKPLPTAIATAEASPTPMGVSGSFGFSPPKKQLPDTQRHRAESSTHQHDSLTSDAPALHPFGGFSPSQKQLQHVSDQKARSPSSSSSDTTHPFGDLSPPRKQLPAQQLSDPFGGFSPAQRQLPVQQSHTDPFGGFSPPQKQLPVMQRPVVSLPVTVERKPSVVLTQPNRVDLSSAQAFSSTGTSTTSPPRLSAGNLAPAPGVAVASSPSSAAASMSESPEPVHSLSDSGSRSVKELSEQLAGFPMRATDNLSGSPVRVASLNGVEVSEALCRQPNKPLPPVHSTPRDPWGATTKHPHQEDPFAAPHKPLPPLAQQETGNPFAPEAVSQHSAAPSTSALSAQLAEHVRPAPTPPSNFQKPSQDTGALAHSRPAPAPPTDFQASVGSPPLHTRPAPAPPADFEHSAGSPSLHTRPAPAPPSDFLASVGSPPTHTRPAPAPPSGFFEAQEQTATQSETDTGPSFQVPRKPLPKPAGPMPEPKAPPGRPPRRDTMPATVDEFEEAIEYSTSPPSEFAPQPPSTQVTHAPFSGHSTPSLPVPMSDPIPPPHMVHTPPQVPAPEVAPSAAMPVERTAPSGVASQNAATDTQSVTVAPEQPQGKLSRKEKKLAEKEAKLAEKEAKRRKREEKERAEKEAREAKIREKEEAKQAKERAEQEARRAREAKKQEKLAKKNEKKTKVKTSSKKTKKAGSTIAPAAGAGDVNQSGALDWGPAPQQLPNWSPSTGPTSTAQHVVLSNASQPQVNITNANPFLEDAQTELDQQESAPVYNPPQRPAPPPGMDCRRAIVLWDFTAENEREITVSADERVVILKSDNPDWWFIKSVQSDESGFI